MILHWETLFQRDAQGKAIVDIIKDNGMIPGIKVDKGYNKKLGFGDFMVFLISQLVKPQKIGEPTGIWWIFHSYVRFVYWKVSPLIRP